MSGQKEMLRGVWPALDSDERGGTLTASDPTRPAGDAAREADPGRDQIVMPRRERSYRMQAMETATDPVLCYDFGPCLQAKLRILVLKLDHLGDFIIGTPALTRLRTTFPAAHIRLVVGSWNQAAAEASKLADEVVTYNYFPQHALGWDGKPAERVEQFRALTAERYDIAVDLRVEEDTRWLLTDVAAGLRCGIGSRSRHPFLDVILPPEHAAREHSTTLDLANTFIHPSRFESAMPFRHIFHDETDFRPAQGHVIYGPYITLPRGRFKATFNLRLIGWRVGLGKTSVTIDISRDGQEIGVSRRLRAQDLKAVSDDGVSLSFENDDVDARHEFRIYIAGHPLRSRLRFGGMHLTHLESVAPARFRTAELHVGEQLSFLIQLVLDRAKDLYGEAAKPDPARSQVTTTGISRIAIAPFSNSNLRDWPFAHYVALIRMLLDRLNCSIDLLGSPQQAAQLEHMVAETGNSARVCNLGGKTAWAEMSSYLRKADLVICNNSGIAHLAASAGALTLAIYSASHQPQEWGPRGARSHALMSVVPCSPCGYDRLDECPYEHRCMQNLLPETVFAKAAALLSTSLTAIASPEAPSDTAH